MITILCPTYDRPAQCKRMVESAIATADNPVEIILGISGEQPDRAYADYEAAGFPESVWFTMAGPYPTAHVLNTLAEKAKGSLLMIVGDDCVFATPSWDTALIKAYNALDDKLHLFSLRDSRDMTGTPHPVVTKELKEALGYLAPPIFLHFFVDTWLVDIAKATNRFTHLMDYLLVHDKPSDRGNADNTHKRIRAMGYHERDMAVYKTCERYKQFDIERVKNA